MKVKELIEELKKFPEDMDVVYEIDNELAIVTEVDFDDEDGVRSVEIR